MIKTIFFVLWILLLVCQNHEKIKHFPNHKKNSIVSKKITSVQVSNKANNNFYSLLGMDSVARSDFLFIDYLIDSISTKKITFDAIYLECFKGKIHLNIYSFLKKINVIDYRAIAQIAQSNTAHLLIVDNIEFPFDGKSNIDCFAESTKVDVKATVYSFFSNKKGLGKFIILDSIIPETSNNQE